MPTSGCVREASASVRRRHTFREKEKRRGCGDVPRMCPAHAHTCLRGFDLRVPFPHPDTAPNTRNIIKEKHRIPARKASAGRDGCGRLGALVQRSGRWWRSMRDGRLNAGAPVVARRASARALVCADWQFGRGAAPATTTSPASAASIHAALHFDSVCTGRRLPPLPEGHAHRQVHVWAWQHYCSVQRAT